ncbi:murein hydrolase activator EnvC family protein [Maritalea porphyrae]|uniref:murein hydrolase activator EnvC family protein n=1 Tax=Maritalea porphyrae TaxID=880732 RepID=UPI0024E057AC|nr:peptidoglycan DD-metalloendopeptidase family protein [Maritalea porphyrae]
MARALFSQLILRSLLVCGMFSASIVGPVWAQFVDPQTAEDARTELERVEQTINISTERIDSLRKEIADMEGDRSQQTAALIASAQRVKLAEIEVTAISERMAELRAEENSIKATLDLENSEIGTLLTALQIIGRNPPPALIVEPNNATKSARAALLLSSILPQLSNRADAIRIELDALLDIKQQVEAEETELRENLNILREEKLRIAVLIEARKEGVERASQALDAEQREAELLASRAKSLNQLLKVLEEEVQSVTEANEAARQSDETPRFDVGVQLENEAIQLALADTNRTQPAFPFELGKGHLVPPTNGVSVIEFGNNDGFGGISQGTFIVTRAEAQVVAPADGWVLYQGPYLNYGQIVILNVGQNYNILLAGLAQTNVELGQFVLMGEPVGIMGKRTISQTIATSAGNSRPTLYIELRQEGEPMDPSDWWATTRNTTQNG